ncbi:AAEL003023-PA [Aedes aegypti]|uniref:AAEL003023-PA n=1 Tax=Aedes aegypti TaxID=7159 RepID=Q0IGB0_AEDAE|nr:AAEL003042-PA [Aedes aegypti]EAT45729.1 AAEL003023-PA [Aedes aegypti]
MSESESDLSSEEALGRLSVGGVSDQRVSGTVKIERDNNLPPNVVDRSKKNKRACKLKMKEQYKVDFVRTELAQVKLAARSAARAVASPSATMNTRMPDFRDQKEYVSTFDPKVPSCLSADIWVKSIDDTGDLYEWTNAVRLHCARLNLGGCAKLWLESFPNAMRDWATFKAEIVKGFPSKKNLIYYHNLLSSRKWKPGETVEEYVYETLALGRKGGFDEETTVTYITSGLRQYVKRSVKTIGKVSTVETLLDELRWIDSVDAVAASKVADILE